MENMVHGINQNDSVCFKLKKYYKSFKGVVLSVDYANEYICIKYKDFDVKTEIIKFKDFDSIMVLPKRKTIIQYIFGLK